MALNINEFPPGGWLFYQPQTKWNAPFPLIDSFQVTVRKIQGHRSANPKAQLSLEPEDIAKDLVDFTEARLGIRRTVHWQPLPEVKKGKKKCGGCG